MEKEAFKTLLSEALPLVDTDSDFLFWELDSLDITAIIMLISDKCGVEITHKDVTARNFRSLDSLWNLIQTKQMQK